MAPRSVDRIVIAHEQAEGQGARVRRSIGNGIQLDPFLLLDLFSIAKPAGFPDHPHRGQQTVTYMLEGEVRHEDNRGHAGTIKAGDLQVRKGCGGTGYARERFSFFVRGLFQRANFGCVCGFMCAGAVVDDGGEGAGSQRDARPG